MDRQNAREYSEEHRGDDNHFLVEEHVNQDYVTHSPAEVESYDELLEWPQRIVKEMRPIIMLYMEKQQIGAGQKAVLRTISDGLWCFGFDYGNVAVANKWKSLVRAYKHSIEMQPRDSSPNVNLARFIYLVRMEQLKRRLENYGRCFLTDEIMQDIN